ncbi:MAG: class III signal peptide-containing protein [Candidatus Hodarchaeales archaeon]|jgi:uncharacterized protein (UPF0333 family)
MSRELFLPERKGQGSIEYILLIGGIILAAVAIFALYYSMGGRAGNNLNNPLLFPTDEVEVGNYECSNKNTVDFILGSGVSQTTRTVNSTQAQKLMQKNWVCTKI